MQRSRAAVVEKQKQTNKQVSINIYETKPRKLASVKVTTELTQTGHTIPTKHTQTNKTEANRVTL